MRRVENEKEKLQKQIDLLNHIINELEEMREKLHHKIDELEETA
jgi:peptidoglycan hydrolase CwlO-like protein